MDEIMEELEAIRDEQSVIAHQVSDNTRRITTLEFLN